MIEYNKINTPNGAHETFVAVVLASPLHRLCAYLSITQMDNQKITTNRIRLAHRQLDYCTLGGYPAPVGGAMLLFGIQG